MPRRTAPRSRSQTGFTLIELLVVVSIIAILAALLLPAVRIVRDLATNNVCGNNLRNLAAMVLTYTTEQEGLLPYRQLNSEWWERMPNELDDQYLRNYKANRKDVLHCPFADREIANPWTFTDRFTVHFGMNVHLRAAWTGTGATGWQSDQPPVPITRVSTKTVLLGDNRKWLNGALVYFEGYVESTAGGGPWPVNLAGTNGTSVTPIRFHGRAANLVCVDGRTERVQQTWDATRMQGLFKTPASKR